MILYQGVLAGYPLQFRAILSPTRIGIFTAILDAVSTIKHMVKPPDFTALPKLFHTFLSSRNKEKNK
jgi:hypothetical protein